MKKITHACVALLALLFVGNVLLSSCANGKDERASFDIRRVWKLSEVVYYDGESSDYSASSSSWLRIYDDSCYYVCRMLQAPNGLMFIPSSMDSYTLIDRGQDDYLYLHGDDKHPLTVQGDSIIIIQENGVRYVWKTTDELDENKVSTVVDIIRNDAEHNWDTTSKYVLSYAERDLEETQHTLVYSLILAAFVLMMVLNFAYIQHREKKRIERTLRQIEQEHQTTPLPVREALHTVEDEFHASSFYLDLRRRIAADERLGDEDYAQIEEHFQSVYPRFSSTLRSLIRMSEVEYRVCLLLKLDVSPSEIANVLCRDKSSISTVRSRLYSKVFDKKGSSRDWDEFIRTL